MRWTRREWVIPRRRITSWPTSTKRRSRRITWASYWRGIQRRSLGSSKTLILLGRETSASTRWLKIELGARVVPFFFQFKAPKVQRMASGDTACWSHFGGVHYRFPLREDRRGSKDRDLPLYRQHNLLVALRQRHIAMYVAPLCHSKEDLALFRRHQAVQDRSVYIDPKDIGWAFDRDEQSRVVRRHRHALGVPLRVRAT
jgi:hypothetical protein